jgi:hypothetical protein
MNMPLDVEHAEVTMDAISEAPAATRALGSRLSISLAERDALKARLKPIVLEILDEALASHRRSLGR